MILICPKCRKPLVEENGVFHCENRHSYDKAREGYVNLVLANQKHSKLPGDDPFSLASRDAFLKKGYYDPLAARLSELVNRLFSAGDKFLDAGCGTGYYLKYIVERNDQQLDYYGCDVAKKGVSLAAKSCKGVHWFVGNVFHLPFEDEALDGLMSDFCPYSSEEFNRVIRKGGYVIAVTPGRNHLYQLKEIVYQNPYFNDEKGYALEGFELAEQTNVRAQIHLDNNEDIKALWSMMPYIHNTYYEDSQKLLSRNEAVTDIDFLVSVYRKVAE